MSDVPELRRICMGEAGSVRGIPVVRVGLLHFMIEAEAAPWNMLTLDRAEEVLDRMGSLPPVIPPTKPMLMAVVAEVAQALLLGRTLTAPAAGDREPPGSTCTAGPVVDDDDAPGWKLVDFDGDEVEPVETWDVTCDDGWCRPKTQRDRSPFGVALAFVNLVGYARATDALQAPASSVATGAQAAPEDAPAGHGSAALPILDGGSPDEAEEELVPMVVKAHRATSTRGGAVHHVVDEAVYRGRWVRTPGQALCKPRGLRLSPTSAEAGCLGCIEEVTKRGLVLRAEEGTHEGAGPG